MESLRAAPQARITELANALRDGSLPLSDYLGQLEAYFEKREPEVQAFVPEEDRFQRLRRDAQNLLDQYPEPATRPPLFGVPLGVKDIFHTKGFPTQAGSRLPAEELNGQQAAVVTALKQAGVLVLGKTVTTEFAYFAPGPTRNPYHPQHTPGGSSSGSAAAVGACLCPLALGTQTIGSINRPAAFCGVVGYKPSYDRISRSGVIPLSPSLDHVGFFTQDVAGLALVVGLVAVRWQPDVVPPRPVLGIPRGPYMEHASREGILHFRDVTEKLGRAGYTVKLVDAMPDFEAIELRHRALVAAEASEVHEEWFSRYDHLYHARTAELLTRGAVVPEEVVVAARAGREQLRQELTDLMDEHGVDLWLAPAATGAAPQGLDSTGDPIMNLPWTHSGLPSLTLPSGKNEDGLPLGIQLIGRWYEDEALLEWAEKIETLLGGAECSS
jgi:Asp-tRNA(Asn)/Glu-tRNA(Gln) amidotransferase A subunit family amidase